MDCFLRFVSHKRSRPPKCAALFLTAAFLFMWILMPGSASAQLYVAQDGKGSVSEYDPTSGAAINGNLITGLAGPGGLALSGNTLFVANAGGDMVGKYTVNATMVTEVNPTFINSGLSTPIAVAVSGSHLFVVNAAGNTTIGEYDANTGMLQNASVLPPSTTQVGGPSAIAVSSNYLFVAHYQESTFGSNNYGLGSVGQYDLNSGAVVNERLIKGLAGPIGLAVSGDTLFVVSSGYTAAGAGRVGKYDATTGAPVNAAFITGLMYPQGIAVFGDKVFVSIKSSGLGSVGFYDASGVLDKTHSVTGVLSPYGVAVGSLATPLSPTRILFFDGSKGKTVDATAETQSVVVGQKIQVTADPVGTGPWEVTDSAGQPAKIINKYFTPPLPSAYTDTTPATYASVTPVTSATLGVPATTSFYFVTPGTLAPSIYNVTYHFTQSNGQPTTAVAKFKVDGPVATATSVTTKPGSGFSGLQISSASVGFPIDFMFLIKPPDSDGYFFWTQVIDSYVINRVAQKSGLDSAFPYAHQTGECYNHDTEDNPIHHIAGPVGYTYTEKLSPTMYLMWKWTGTAPQTIPVSLGALPWSVVAHLVMTTKGLLSNPAAGPTIGYVGAFSPITSFPDVTQGFPQWAGYALNTVNGKVAPVDKCDPPPPKQ
jgi:hypothetical protein